MIGAIILAAGCSRRFGDDKRKARLMNGKMVIEQTLDNVLQHFEDIILTLRNDDHQFHNTLVEKYKDNAFTIFQAPNSALGIGNSLASAVKQIDDWDGVFIFLADMPYIKSGTLKSLTKALRNENIVLPLHEGQRGHPVGFGRRFFGQLSALKGDAGAKEVLLKNADEILEVSVPDHGVLKDIDRPADIA